MKIWLFGLCAFVFAIADSSRPAGSLVLVENGKAQAQIIISAQSDAVTAFAAAELRDYIKKMSGAELAIRTTPSPSLSVIRFELGRAQDYQFDGYNLEIAPGGIRITAGNSRGLLYGAYDILEQLGCAWVYPGCNEEVVPQAKTLALKAGKIVRKPVIERRGLALYGLDTNSVPLSRDIIDWMAKNRFNLLLTSEDRPSDSGKSAAHDTRWGQVADQLLPEVKKRGIILDMSEHSTRLFFPPSLFDEHPDWFAMDSKGQRHLGQMCYSNPDGIEYYANRLAEYAAKHPEVSILGTWPLDGGGYCCCSNCQKPDVVFKAVVKVAEKVAKVRPDITVEYLAYKPQTYPVPTTVPIPKNVSVLVCGRTDQLARDWAAATRDKGGAYYFEYRTGDNWYWAANVWLRPEYVRDIVQTSTDVGFRGMISLFLPIQNWWRSCFNFYFMGRAYWDPRFSVDTELRTYCDTYYGKQSGQAYEIFKLITGGLQNDGILKSQRAWAHSWPEQEVRFLDPSGLERSRNAAAIILEKLDKAQKDTSDPVVQHRLERIRTYVEYFQLYYQARYTRSEQDEAALVAYAVNHSSGKEGVCMEPNYVRFILQERPILFGADEK